MPRYLSLIRIDENNAPEGGPSPELMQRMGELIEEMTKNGVLLDTAGLTPTAQGSRVHYEGGQLSVTDGPFTETKEVIGGYAVLQAKCGPRGRPGQPSSISRTSQVTVQCGSCTFRNRLVHSIASALSLAWRRAYPPMTSLVSVNGPSVTDSCPPS